MIHIRSFDIEFYQQNLRAFLPERIIDIHTHVWLDKYRKTTHASEARLATWPSRVAKDNSIEDLKETYDLLFPDKKVSALMFSMAESGDDLDILNNYVTQSSQKSGFQALIFASPNWDTDEFKNKILEGGFIGAKVYLSLAPTYIPGNEIRIFDFAPIHQLKVLNDLGGILMLHIPRPNRLKDTVNLAQLLEIEEKYPNIKLIIAHVGRAYCNEDIGNAFDILSKTKNMLFDISANSNEYVFHRLIETVGPKRILFGSDLPILQMRARRVTENNAYINIVPKGLYGDVSGDKNMREASDAEADKITFFLYEEIAAFKRAALAAKLTPAEIEDIFYTNANSIISSAKLSIDGRRPYHR
jgi:predicted TIM-barrel fold metal-dependent hydrolase